jgi:hypothetical protein
VTDDVWLREQVEAEVESAAERIRAIPWCTTAMATNADHIARAVLESFFDAAPNEPCCCPRLVTVNVCPVHGWRRPDLKAVHESSALTTESE